MNKRSGKGTEVVNTEIGPGDEEIISKQQINIFATNLNSNSVSEMNNAALLLQETDIN